MRILKSVCICGLGSCFGTIACSSHSGADSANQNPGYNVNGGGAGSGLVAQDTADGTTPITAAQATSLTSNPCVQSSSTPQGAAPPVLEFVIDTSGSMSSDPANPAQPNGPSKWTVFSQTMPNVFASLPANFAVGVTYFNKGNGNAAYVGTQAVPIAPMAAAQLTAVDNSLARTTPGGYTPTYNAWEFGLSTLTGWQAPAGYTTSPKYIVLITDGVPTVLHDGRTIENPINQTEYNAQIYGGVGSPAGVNIAGEQADGKAANVKTFVVGVVGSENPQGATYDPMYMLSLLAVAGGTAPAGCVPVSGTPAGTTVNPRGTYCHFDLSQATDFATALSSTLTTIAQSVISCNYTVPPPSNGQVVDPSKTVLVYNDGNGNYSLVLPNTSSTCDKGYQFTDSTDTEIEICATTCAALQKNPNASLEVIFGCSTGQIVN